MDPAPPTAHGTDDRRSTRQHRGNHRVQVYRTVDLARRVKKQENMSAFRYGTETNAFGDTIGDLDHLHGAAAGYPSSSSSSTTFGGIGGGIGGDLDLNRSYNSSTSNPASSSKAVLNALRSLQDKIRRLEGERTQVLDECTQLRHQVKTQEMETEQLRQRESLAAQKSLHEARTAYERALTEKTDTEVRLGKVEERNREEQRVAEELRVKTKALQDEKHHGLLALKELEAQKAHLQSQITYAQQKEKDLGQTILFETKRHEEDMDVLGRYVCARSHTWRVLTSLFVLFVCLLVCLPLCLWRSVAANCALCKGSCPRRCWTRGLWRPSCWSWTSWWGSCWRPTKGSSRACPGTGKKGPPPPGGAESPQGATPPRGKPRRPRPSCPARRRCRR